MRAAKIDRNQPEIVAALRQLGCSVQILSTVGHGCPDLLVGFRSRNALLEVKDGLLPPSGRTLTPDQQAWHAMWRGQVDVVLNVEQAIARMLQ